MKGIAMSNLPSFTMRQLIEAGVHFGHNTRRWNPKMAPYLFGVRNGIHIIDLQQTVPALHRGIQAIRDVVAAGGRVLFVGTKRAAAEIVAESAKRCGQYMSITAGWAACSPIGKTISLSIKASARDRRARCQWQCRRSDQEGAAEPVPRAG